MNSRGRKMNKAYEKLVLIGFAVIITTLLFHSYVLVGMLEDEESPYLYAAGEIIDSPGEWDKRIMESFDITPPSGEGFTYSLGDKKWVLKVSNNSKRVATNVKVAYEITAYRNEIEFGEDRLDIVDFNPVVYKQVRDEVAIDYIPPGGTSEITLFYMSTYPEAELAIESISSSEGNYLTEKTTISKYKHEEFELIEDMQHLRRMLGIN